MLKNKRRNKANPTQHKWEGTDPQRIDKYGRTYENSISSKTKGRYHNTEVNGKKASPFQRDRLKKISS